MYSIYDAVSKQSEADRIRAREAILNQNPNGAVEIGNGLVIVTYPHDRQIKIDLKNKKVSCVSLGGSIDARVAD